MVLYQNLLLVLAASPAWVVTNPIAPHSSHASAVVEHHPHLYAKSPSSRNHRRVERQLTPEMLAKSIGQGPRECEDLLNPSEECKKAIADSLKKEEDVGDGFVGIAGGKVKYGWYSGCETVKKSMLVQAAYDAWDLAKTVVDHASDEDMIPIWNTWMGPDHKDYKGRIIG